MRFCVLPLQYLFGKYIFHDPPTIISNNLFRISWKYWRNVHSNLQYSTTLHCFIRWERVKRMSNYLHVTSAFGHLYETSFVMQYYKLQAWVLQIDLNRSRLHKSWILISSVHHTYVLLLIRLLLCGRILFGLSLITLHVSK